MSQYTKVYCDQGARGKAWAVLRYGHCAYDTARGAPATRRPAPTTRLAGACDTALGACDTVGWGGHDTATRARLGVLAGQQVVHLVHPACFWTQYCF